LCGSLPSEGLKSQGKITVECSEDGRAVCPDKAEDRKFNPSWPMPSTCTDAGSRYPTEDCDGIKQNNE